MKEIRMAEVSDHLYRKAALARIPLSGTFELTPRCNLQCRMCFRNSWRDEAIGDMSMETFLRAMDTMPASVETVFFGGMGEPLAHANILDMVREAKARGVRITAETAPHYIGATDEWVAGYDSNCRVNPPLREEADRQACIAGLVDGTLDCIATDHAPHLLAEKQGGALKATSGMPMIQFSLVSMLELVNQGVFDIETVVEKMCHAPARLYGIEERGFLREGYMADLVLVRPDASWLLTPDCIQSKCGWSPLQGYPFNWQVEKTFVNGRMVYNGAEVDESFRGQELRFS